MNPLRAPEALARLVGPLASLAGSDLHQVLTPRVEQAAPRLAGQLDDEDEQTRTATDVMLALWGRDDPDDDWWRTPLGRRCARALAHDSTEAVTYERAARMLGLARGTVSTMVRRGALDRHPGGPCWWVQSATHLVN